VTALSTFGLCKSTCCAGLNRMNGLIEGCTSRAVRVIFDGQGTIYAPERLDPVE